MWPWEHAAVGYLTYSVAVHLLRRRSPTGPEAIAVVSASVLPDAIDKPLAWEFGVFPSGYGLAHSVFFAGPLAAVVVGVAAAAGRSRVGVAFATGYLLHLAGDVMSHLLRDGTLPVSRVLWPVATTESAYPDGFVGTLREYAGDALSDVLSGPPSPYVLVVVGTVAGCVLLWVYDGMPGVSGPARYLRERLEKR
ncbi:metal-dependent hydrolase [Halorubrum trueperi]|uniref:Metal-dependent hydrolase n=1 Tax=Halorubrum trueperi TaxID=2004704 RepID=A0ABD5UNK3_9EURY